MVSPCNNLDLNIIYYGDIKISEEEGLVQLIMCNKHSNRVEELVIAPDRGHPCKEF